MTLQGYADDLLEICAELDLSDVVFVGHSVSAMIGVLASIAEPERFAALVLVGPSACYLDDPATGYVGGFSQADIANLLETLDDNFLGWSTAMAPAIMGNADRPELGRELTESFCRTDPDIASAFARVTFLSDSRADLPRVQVPTLVLQTTQDVIADVPVGEYVRDHVPGSGDDPAGRHRPLPQPQRPRGDDRGHRGLPGPTAPADGHGRRRRPWTSTPSRTCTSEPRAATSRPGPTARSCGRTGTFLDWTGFTDEELIGAPFTDLLTAGGRIFYETNYAPVLHLQGEVRDIAFDLRRAGREPFPVLVSSVVVDDVGDDLVIRSTIFDATSRHEYERELLAARRRAEASERETRAVAVQLQRSLLAGELADGDGFVVETRYRPAVEDLEVGGDWYDAFCLPDRDVVNVSVGDVVGRGIAAACAMGQIRSALRAIAVSGVGPARTLDQLDAFVERIPDAHSATVVCAEVDLDDRWVRYACAGHLPPLLLAPDGTVTYLWEGRSTPLAAVRQAGPRSEGEVTLEPGSRLLLFTDGLVERRDRGLDEGLETLARMVVDTAVLPPGEMVDAVMGAMLHNEDVRDDVCVLCLTLVAD